MRSTEIETFDRASVILPNSDLIAGTVLNRTHTGMSGRLQVPVSVAYDTDPKRVEAILLDIAEGHPLVLQEPAPRVLFMDLGPNSMNFELRCWLRDVNFSLSVRSDMNFEIIERFRARGHPHRRSTAATCRPRAARGAAGRRAAARQEGGELRPLTSPGRSAIYAAPVGPQAARGTTP